MSINSEKDNALKSRDPIERGNKGLTEPQIRQIIRDEVKKSFFTLPKIPPHRHDGVDNININENDVIGNRINTGTITFTSAKEYTIKVNFVPKSIWCYATVFNGSNKFMSIGNALFGGVYSSPSTASSVGISTVSPQIYGGIAQSCNYFGVDSGGTSHVLASQTNIINVFYGGTLYARMHVESVTNMGIVLNVSTLVSGWEIDASFVIT